VRIRQNPESWEIGYQDGLQGTKERKSTASDRLAYNSGFIEGRATRLSFAQTDAETATANVEAELRRRGDFEQRSS